MRVRNIKLKILLFKVLLFKKGFDLILKYFNIWKIKNKKRNKRSYLA